MLRDVLCGYLDSDLKGVADDILLETNPEPFVEIEARDLRVPKAAAPPPAPAPEPKDSNEDTAEMEAVAEEPVPVQRELEGVTQSADWGFDDPADFSAPV
jgi:hypothetical protein